MESANCLSCINGSCFVFAMHQCLPLSVWHVLVVAVRCLAGDTYVDGSPQVFDIYEPLIIAWTVLIT